MSEFSSLVERVRKGKHPYTVVSEAVSGPERKDDFTDPNILAQEFQKIAGQCANAYANIGPDWINSISDQIRTSDAEGMAELVDLANRNREIYSGSARMDAGGSFELWDSVLRGLLAVQTNQLPPPAPNMM